ncbi:phosphatase PAP2 family protein [Natronococcus occultus]|uniref:PAP2 family phosphatase n=1 Tax=Natronococcus occultus SP4 TaxID=694430 RepID=L0K388_9EURY|nr:phosphatase PAP2 family protein [Natronococcus occultus]AGB39025.1 PAP2 family phosphatase [Natronococcus occultus SP4]
MSRSLGVMETIRTAVPEWSLDAFAATTLLGDLVVVVPALALWYLLDVGATLRRANPDADSLCSDRTAVLVATVFGGLALVVALESVFALPRPPAEYHAISASEFGFPSGHTMAATVFWGAVAAWLSVGRRSVRYGLAGAIVAVVALSRLALGVHYLVDVVASVAFGVTYLVAVSRLTRGDPKRVFLAALVIALAALVLAGANDRAVLAAAGTAGASAGWWVLERQPVRRRVLETYARLV